MMTRSLRTFLWVILCAGWVVGCATAPLPPDGKKKSEAKYQLGNSLIYEKNYLEAVNQLRQWVGLDHS